MKENITQEHISSVYQEIKRLNIHYFSLDDNFIKDYYDAVGKVRNYFISQETEEERKNYSNLADGTWWDLTPKYRIDALGREIPTIFNQFALVIGLASLYHAETSTLVPPLITNSADALYWLTVDNGYRLASSGWDRISLLLDTVYSLHTSYECSFTKVLKELPKKYGGITSNEYFKALKKVRDREFKELESRRGKGIRHEITHLLSQDTRFFLEYLEVYDPNNKEIIARKREEREVRLQKLTEHHQLLYEALYNALKLINSYNPFHPETLNAKKPHL